MTSSKTIKSKTTVKPTYGVAKNQKRKPTMKTSSAASSFAIKLLPLQHLGQRL